MRRRASCAALLVWIGLVAGAPAPAAAASEPSGGLRRQGRGLGLARRVRDRLPLPPAEAARARHGAQAAAGRSCASTAAHAAGSRRARSVPERSQADRRRADPPAAGRRRRRVGRRSTAATARELERFARRMLVDVAPDQVDDVVQEALWRAHRALHRDTRVLELRPWLYRLTRNCCLDERARVRTDAVELRAGARRPARRTGGDARAPRRAAHAARRPRAAARTAAARAAAARARRLSHDELASRAGAHPRRHAQPRAPGARRAHPRRRGAHVGCDRRPPRHPRRLRRAAPADRPHAAPPRTCSSCRALQSALRSQRRKLAVLAPPVGLLAALGGVSLARRAREGGDDRDDAVVAAGVSVELFEAGDPAPMALTSIAVPGKRARRRRADPRRRRDRPARGRFPSSATSRWPARRGLRLADLLPPEGGRVSAHYDAATTIGADQTGRVVLTGDRRARHGRRAVPAARRERSIVDASTPSGRCPRSRWYARRPSCARRPARPRCAAASGRVSPWPSSVACAGLGAGPDRHRRDRVAAGAGAVHTHQGAVIRTRQTSGVKMRGRSRR